jgi:tetratricopeptide (TPR) repeat protein
MNYRDNHLTAGERALVKAIGGHASTSSVTLDDAVDRAMRGFREGLDDFSQARDAALESVGDRLDEGNALLASSIGSLGRQIDESIETQGREISQSINSHGMIVAAVGFAAFLGLTAIATQLGRVNYTLNNPLEAKANERTKQAISLFEAYHRSKQSNLLQTAVACLDTAIEHDPSSSSAYIWRARCRVELRLSEPAEADYRTALALSGGPDGWQIEFAMWLHRAGRAKDALMHLNLVAEPTDFTDIFRIRLLCETNEIDEALCIARELVEAKPTSLPILLASPEHTAIRGRLHDIYAKKSGDLMGRYRKHRESLLLAEELCARSRRQNANWKHDAVDIHLHNNKVHLIKWSPCLSNFPDPPTTSSYADLITTVEQLQAVQAKTWDHFAKAAEEEGRRANSALVAHLDQARNDAREKRQVIGGYEDDIASLRPYDPQAGLFQSAFDSITGAGENRRKDREQSLRSALSHVENKEASYLSRAGKYEDKLRRSEAYYAELKVAISRRENISYPPKL